MTGTTRTATQRLDEYLAAIGGPTTATLAAGVLGLTRAEAAAALEKLVAANKAKQVEPPAGTLEVCYQTTTLTAAEKADHRVLMRLPAGWRQDGPGRWRFDCTGPEPATGNPVFLRIQRHTGADKGWTATRFEMRNGEACGTNGFFEKSLTRLLTHIG